MLSHLPCPTLVPSTDGRQPGSVQAETRHSCGSMRPSSTPMSLPLQRSLPANTSLALCPPLCRSRLHLNACLSTKWTEAAEPSMTLSRRTCRDLACVWTLCMMSYGGQAKTRDTWAKKYTYLMTIHFNYNLKVYTFFIQVLASLQRDVVLQCSDSRCQDALCNRSTGWL